MASRILSETSNLLSTTDIISLRIRASKNSALLILKNLNKCIYKPI